MRATQLQRTPIEVRSDNGKLLFRASADGRVVEVVDRRRRYVVELGILRVDPVVVVCAVVEEVENPGDTNPVQS